MMSLLENCCHLVLCSDVPWDPNDPLFARQEQAVAHHSDVSAVRQHGDSVGGDDVLPSLLPTPAELLSDKEFACRLVLAVNVAGDDWIGDRMSGYADEELFPIGNQGCKVFAMSLVDKQSVVTKEVLARREISMDTAHRTLRATTQRGVRPFLNPTDC
jgi:hypothetical protein